VALEVGKVDLFEVGSKLRVAENPLIKIVHDRAHGRPRPTTSSSLTAPPVAWSLMRARPSE
jgi:hypothetical protein